MTLPNKKIGIVGAGIAGLTAGIYAQNSGFDVEILEQGAAPGGNCTGWSRKGYYIEGALHWLTGSSPCSLNKIWRDVDVINDSVDQKTPDIVTTLYYENETIYIYSDPAKLQSYLLQLSPQDEKAIRLLCKDMVTFSKMEMPNMNVKGVKIEPKEKGMGISALVGMMGCLKRMSILSNMNIETYLAPFKHKGVKAALTSLLNTPNYSAMALLVTMGTYVRGDGAYLDGGSNGMIERMVRRFKSLGGTLSLGSNVERVVVQGGKVTGVIVNGKERVYDGVIVSADSANAIDRLFKRPLEDDWIKQMKASFSPTLCSFVSLGLRKELHGLSKSLSFPVNPPFEHMGVRFDLMNVWQYGDYPAYAPKGCTSISLPIMGNTYDQWKSAKESGRYEQEKQKLGELVKDCIISAFPEWDGLLDVLDVATPLTYERYCQTKMGSWMSHMAPGSSTSGYPGTVESLPNLFFAGQRLMPPGGMPGALITGRTAAQYLCRHFATTFRSPR